MKVIEKNILYFLGFLGIAGFFGSSILTIVCTLYVVVPNSPGNKYIDELPTIFFNTSSFIFLSGALNYNVFCKLSELNNFEEDQED